MIETIKVIEIASKINKYLDINIPLNNIWKDIHKNDWFFINEWENMSK
jgi:hypothetical protein